MYGAILGDIIGSPFEFDRGRKTKEFEFFTRGCGFTDDSVMTVAIAEALIAIGPDANEMERNGFIFSRMKKRYIRSPYPMWLWKYHLRTCLTLPERVTRLLE